MRGMLPAILVLSVASACVVAEQPEVEMAVARQAVPFSPADVRLLEGPFREARDRHAGYLLSIEADRLLARYRAEAGLEPRAEGYHGWEDATISGHSLGHYLSAISKMYAGTGDERFRERAGYIAGELAACQAAHGDGYVAAIPDGRRAFAEVARGEIRSKGFDLNGIWVPWYTIHKEMAGLRDAYVYCGEERALRIMAGLGDWALGVTGGLDAGQLSTMLRCEHGGMNEVAADLYSLTGERRYLDLAERFNDHQVLDPLSRGEDVFPGLHANTQIPKLIGAARQHELTGDGALGAAAEFAWTVLTRDHAYVTGGNSLNEYLGPPGVIGARLNGNTTETCNTYNMLRLTRILHSWSADARYMDYYERAVYNHILASQDHRTGAVCYFVQLRPGSRKSFQRLYEDFTCCVGTGMENHASYGDAIYCRDDEGLFVNLFIASEVRWRQRGLVLTQRTRFPDEPGSELEIRLERPTEMTVRVRRPAWAGRGFAVLVNGDPVASGPEASGYVRVRRVWNDGDTIGVRLPMPVRLEAAPDDPSVVSLLAGPVLLAGILGPDRPEPGEVACLVTESVDAGAWVRRTDERSLVFRTVGAAKPEDLELIPFFRVLDRHYNVYWKRLTPDGWEARLAQIRSEEAKRRALEARSSDFVQPGEMQPERDHGFDGERTSHGVHEGLRWRDAHRGGWFAFTMKLPESGPAALICTYWGSDYGDREFDILVDEVVIATQVLNNERPGEFFDVEYPIPEEITRGKPAIRVTFRSHPGKIAGGVFGCRVVKAD